MENIAVVIATIPPRRSMLGRCLQSVYAQQYQPDLVVVTTDKEGNGTAATRSAALRSVPLRYQWVAFVDDDDFLYATHLQALWDVAKDRPDLDVIYPWFDWTDGWKLNLEGPHGDPEGKPFDDAAAEWIMTRGNFIPITALVRHSTLIEAGGFDPAPQSEHRVPDDLLLWRSMLAVGAKFYHVPHRTWQYSFHEGNTLGRRWTERPAWQLRPNPT